MSGKKPLSETITERSETFRDPEIEYQLMAYMVRVHPQSASGVSKEWFSDTLLQDVYTVVEDLRVNMSAAMLMNELRDRSLIGKGEEGLYEEVVEQLFGLDVSTMNEKSAHHMMRQLLKLSESRRVIIACAEVVGSIRRFDLDDAKQKLSGVSKSVDLTDHSHSGYYLDDYGERVDLIREREQQAASSEDAEVGVRTGIYRLDRFTGGILPGEWGIVLGMTGVGKTATLIDFGAHAWEDGFDTMIVSGEMSKHLLEFRIDSYLTRIHGMKFRHASLTVDEYTRWDSRIRAYKAQSEATLFVATYPRRFTVENIERDLLRVQEETGRRVKMICMDYVNIMDPVTKTRRGGWEDQGEAVWDFKALIEEYNISGWTAGQVKDEAYGKELYDASDAKYGRVLSEAAPVIIAMIRTEKDIIENRMKLQVIKMRNADLPTKPIALTPNLGIMRIHEDGPGGRIRKLGDSAGYVEDTKQKTKKVRPKRSLHGKGV